ncbi:MAG: calcium-binding protein [Thiotrichales bacterium]
MAYMYVYGDSSDEVLDLSSLPFEADVYVDGWSGNDVITTGAGNDELDGGQENDELNGGAGADALYGGEGDDLLYFDPEDTVVSGGNPWGSSIEDKDTLVLDGSSDAMRDFAEFEETVREMEVLDFDNGVADEIGVYAGLDSDVKVEQVMAVTDEDNVLYIDGDEDDVIRLDDSSDFSDYSNGKFYDFGSTVEDGQEYQIYSALTDEGQVTVYVDTDITVV